MLYDSVTGNKYTKYVKKLLQIKAAGDYCVLATRTDDPNQYLLILCNAIGAPVDSKYVNLELTYLHMTEQHVVCASEDVVCVWQYSSKVSKLTSIEGNKDAVALKKKDGKEVVWHIDESPSLHSGGFEQFKNAKRSATQDAIQSITASDSMLLVGRQSGTVHRYSLPHIALEAKYILRCCPQLLAINCDSTRMSIIDINGVISFFDMEAGRGITANEQGLPAGEHLAFEKRDAWDMVWAKDNPELMAMMEKSRMYIYRGLQPEEPVVSSGYLCEFKDLSLTVALLDDVFAAVPDPPAADCILHMETKSLRDSRDILEKVGIADAAVFIQDNSHPRLWGLLSEAALEKLDLATAERGFVKVGDYNGVQLVKRLNQLGDKAKQRAEVAVYFKRFDEAEKAYLAMDRLDLAIDMRSRIGDWNKVMKLASTGASSDHVLKTAYLNVGDYYFDRLMWQKAFTHYEYAGAVDKQIPCLYNMEDFDRLAKFAIDPEHQKARAIAKQLGKEDPGEDGPYMLPEGSPLLISIGERLASVGLAEEAVAAYLRGQVTHTHTHIHTHTHTHTHTHVYNRM
jgi:WD repeat-containing protein 35